jgi:hypothetical protein
MGPAPKRLTQTKTVAVGCDRLPKGAHGKEGVDGSSPSEGFANAPEIGAFKSKAAYPARLEARSRSRVMMRAAEPSREPQCSALVTAFSRCHRGC